MVFGAHGNGDIGASVTWPPPPDNNYWNKPKKVRDEYEAVVERAGEKCEGCGSWEVGEFHHVVFRKHGGKTTRDNLKLLCLECHRKAHGR